MYHKLIPEELKWLSKASKRFDHSLMCGVPINTHEGWTLQTDKTRIHAINTESTQDEVSQLSNFPGLDAEWNNLKMTFFRRELYEQEWGIKIDKEMHDWIKDVRKNTSMTIAVHMGAWEMRSTENMRTRAMWNNIEPGTTRIPLNPGYLYDALSLMTWGTKSKATMLCFTHQNMQLSAKNSFFVIELDYHPFAQAIILPQNPDRL